MNLLKWKCKLKPWLPGPGSSSTYPSPLVSPHSPTRCRRTCWSSPSPSPPPHCWLLPPESSSPCCLLSSTALHQLVVYLVLVWHHLWCNHWSGVWVQFKRTSLMTKHQDVDWDGAGCWFEAGYTGVVRSFVVQPAAVCGTSTWAVSR